MKILFLGCGDIGQRTAALLADKHQCFGFKRNPQNLPTGITAIAGNITDPKQLQSAVSQGFDIWVATLTPAEFTERAYRDSYLAAAAAISTAVTVTQRPPKLVIWISSTSVYGDCGGAWVDECSTAEPQTFSGQILLQAEQIIQRLPCANTLVRFSGIYGADSGRSRMLKQIIAGQGRSARPEQWSNRIHREDCAGVLAHLIGLFGGGEKLQDIYLASDSQPATQHQLRRWLAAQMSVELTEELAKPGATRRCSNRRLLEAGYQFKYPSYKEGYLALLAG